MTIAEIVLLYKGPTVVANVNQVVKVQLMSEGPILPISVINLKTLLPRIKCTSDKLKIISQKLNLLQALNNVTVCPFDRLSCSDEASNALQNNARFT
jgi:hypothetical protein